MKHCIENIQTWYDVSETCLAEKHEKRKNCQQIEWLECVQLSEHSHDNQQRLTRRCRQYIQYINLAPHLGTHRRKLQNTEEKSHEKKYLAPIDDHKSTHHIFHK